ncbi:MAG TPA: PD-(D/E)XK nuclease family protein [Aquihabitans sp.]|jgi:hypothetical protein|nr:PD-(D/E)XK nuclease family protein [Aquihabitans sp.]
MTLTAEPTQAVQQFLLDGGAPPAPDAQLVRNGRYHIPDPETGKPRTWQRASNFAKLLDSSEGLTKWKQRMEAIGFVRRGDLHIAAAAAAGELVDAEAALSAAGDDPPDNLVAAVKKAKSDLDAVIDAAIDAAGGTASATTGTALHSFLERINKGQRNVDVPAAWRPDIAAYRREVDRLGLAPIHHEIIVVNPRLGVAGRFDLLARTIHRPLPLVCDYKTGKVDGKALSHALQMVAYATATHIYDPTTGTFTPMPEVDQTEALIIHLPQGQGECTTYSVDLVRGIELADLALAVRDSRSGNKALQVPFDTTAGTWPTPEPTDAGPPDEAPADRTTWIRDRLAVLKDQPAAVEAIRFGWPEGVPAQPPWTDEQADAICATLSAAETACAAPFPAPDPDAEAELAEARQAVVGDDPEPAPPRAPDWPIDDDGTPAEAADLEAIAASVASLTDAQRDRVAEWARSALQTGAPFAGPNQTARTAAICAAVTRLVADLWDDGPADHEALARAAIVMAVSGHIDGPLSIVPSWETGAVLGRLAHEEALRLVEIAAGFAAGDDEVNDQLVEIIFAADAASTTAATATDPMPQEATQ